MRVPPHPALFTASDFMTFLFATGIENGYPTLPNGHRIDQMDRCGHYARWEQDFELVRELGVRALRFGPAYYRTHVAPNRFDWEHADEPMARLRELGIEVIADLCHFGVPSWLGGFQDPAFAVLFGEYARNFARRYPWVRFFTPVHEILTCAANSGLHGRWNECRTDDRSFVRALRNLCMAHELAVEAILSERPDAIIIQAESLEHYHAAGRGAAAEAERWNALKFLSLDLTLGRELAPGMAGYLNQHGVTSNDLSFFRERRAEGRRWIGLDYFATREHRITSTGRKTTSRKGLGFRRLATEYYHRYRVPLFHSETHRATGLAVSWLKEQWEEVLALRASRIPIHGFTWGSLVDQTDLRQEPEAERGATQPVGLYDLGRTIRPVGEAYRALVQRWSVILNVPSRQGGADKRVLGASA